MSTTWTTTDEQFFHVIDGLFPPTFLDGAGVLLASYDVDTDTPADAAVAQTSVVTASPYVAVPAVPSTTR